MKDRKYNRVKKTIQFILVFTLIINMITPIYAKSNKNINSEEFVESSINIYDEKVDGRDLDEHMLKTKNLTEKQSLNESIGETSIVDKSSFDTNDKILETSNEILKVKNSSFTFSKEDEERNHENYLSKAQDNTNLTHFDLSTEIEPTPISLTGSESLLYFDFATSESTSNNNYTVKIEIEGKYVDENSIKASDSDSQALEPTIVKNDDGNYEITYLFNNILGGNSIKVPIKFHTKNGETPDKYILPVKGEIFINDKITPEITETLNFEYKINEPEFKKYIISDTDNYISADGEIVSAGIEDLNQPGYLVDDLEKLTPVSFISKISFENTDYGRRLIGKRVFKDQLPTGGILVDNGNGWSYDPVTGIATYIDNNNHLLGKTSYYTPKINLLFPSAQLNTPLTNSMSAEFYPKNMTQDEDVIISEDNITFKLKNSDDFVVNKWDGIDGGRLNKEKIYDLVSVKENWEGKWGLELKNSSKKPARDLENIKIVDHDLNQKLYYSKLEIPKTPESIFEGSFNIYAKKVTGETVLLDTNVSVVNSDYNINLDESMIQIIIESNNDNKISVLKPNKTLKIFISSKIKDPQQTPVEKTEFLYNELTVTANYKNSIPKKSSALGFKELSPANQNVYISKSPDKSLETSYFVGDSIHYTIGVSVMELLENNIVEFTKLIDLLPTGIEYIENSAKIKKNHDGDYYEFDSNLENGAYEPQIVHNYKGTGKTALIWDILPIKSLKPAKIIKPQTNEDYNAYEISYSTKITKFTEEGKNINRAYIAWSNTDEIKPNSDSKEIDIFDLNNDGNTQDIISGNTATINYVPPKELIVKKFVIGNLDDDYTLSPGIGKSEVGSEAKYKLTLYNNSTNDFSNLTSLDILPYVGDKTIGIDLISGKRIDRNSDYRVKLTDEIIAPEGYKVSYTTDDPIDDTKDYTLNATWTENPTDYSLVKAFKIELKPQSSLKSGEKVEFIVPFKTSSDDSLAKYGIDYTSESKSAINSFGVATTDQLQYIESNNAGIELYKYKVEGNIFEDYNINSIYDSNTEKTFKNLEVLLLDEDGNEVLDLEGNVIKTKTNNNGYYKIDVFRNGNYKIKINVPELHLSTIQNLNDELGSKIDNQGLTPTFTLNINNPVAKINAGFYKKFVNIGGTKTWNDSNNQDGIRPEKITINLLANGEKVISKKVSEVENWIYIFENLPKYEDDNIIKYTITEDPVKGYTTMFDDFNIINTHTPETTSIKITKVWNDSNNQDGIRPEKNNY